MGKLSVGIIVGIAIAAAAYYYIRNYAPKTAAVPAPPEAAGMATAEPAPEAAAVAEAPAPAEPAPAKPARKVLKRDDAEGQLDDIRKESRKRIDEVSPEARTSKLKKVESQADGAFDEMEDHTK